ncbi:sulfite reductase NADPH flavoprotein subunit [Schizosaccharomyces japonicus yFS275]|uniref:assimilatory sulfite reductase (NADPH) n=1 Tax=Schizosaccharomyces japonicus (strain yFS275 / FY16936) TaxID=402676 RepID=B6JYM7_SCHJY|nr:sulfite reductase NADPH flavoprotein subunit [Schizosaccharomyces japonicus yFS275]EEB06645.1 sulfite reductase NADPH flavoprotein subunit [Schizosaccharomyces japonicus yFS275]
MTKEVTSNNFAAVHKAIEQIVYTLSGRIFSYAEHVPLDRYLKQWYESGQKNGFAEQVEFHGVETRSGAAGFLLGSYTSAVSSSGVYSLLTASSCLPLLRPMLSYTHRLYSGSKPLVLHVAALSYEANEFHVDNASLLDFAYTSDFATISSFALEDAAHISLASTLAAKAGPVVHAYEYDTLTTTFVPNEASVSASKTVECFHSFVPAEGVTANAIAALEHVNKHFGTKYAPVEYYGPATATQVIVAFGSKELQKARALASRTSNVGVAAIRVFPVIEESFARVIPKTCKKLVVASQTKLTALDTHSTFFSVVFATAASALPKVQVVEARYSDVDGISESVLAAELDLSSELSAVSASSLVETTFRIWEEDSVESLANALALVHASRDVEQNVVYRTLYDNQLFLGLRVSNVQVSKSSAKLPGLTDEEPKADVTILTSEKIANHVRVLANVADRSLCIVYTAVNPADAAKKLPAVFVKDVVEKDIRLVFANPNEQTHALNLVLLAAYFVQLKRNGADSTSVPSLKKNFATLGWDADEFDAVVKDLEGQAEPVKLNPDVLKELQLPEDELPTSAKENSFEANTVKELEEEVLPQSGNLNTVAKQLIFKEAYGQQELPRPNAPAKICTVRVKSNKRLTPRDYNRNIFHIEFDIGESGLTYDIGEALGVYGVNNKANVEKFIADYGLKANEVIYVPSLTHPGNWESNTVFQALSHTLDIFGKPTKQFYQTMAEYAADPKEKRQLEVLISPAGAADLQRRSEVDMLTYADLLLEFKSAKMTAVDLARHVPVLKRREYSISSSQRKHKDAIHLLVVVVGWTDPMGRDRYGQCSHYLSQLQIGDTVCVAVKPSVMKLPDSPKKPIVMAGLGTGLAPFRAFLQYKEWQWSQGIASGDVILYLGSRTQREEYLYGEDWEAYHAAGLLTHIGQAFSRDQPYKIYIQDVMRSTKALLKKALIDEGGSFYLCGPTWPLPEITSVLEEVIQSSSSEPVDTRKVIEQWKEDRRFVIEVY